MRRFEFEPKPSKKPIVITLIISSLLLLILVFLLFYFYSTAAPSKAIKEVENPALGETLENALGNFDISYVDYLVSEFGGWKLHNPPLSSDTPKIKIIVDGEVFVSEVINGEIITEKRDIENPDIILTITKEDISKAVVSSNLMESLRKSIDEGNSNIELKASYTKLFSKGYLNIYKDVTGEGFTGSVIKIFSQG